MQIISFVSKCHLPPGQRTSKLQTLAQQAERQSKTLALTGVLLWGKNYIFQTIEGPPPHVQQALYEIETDSALSHISILLNEDTHQRSFANWSSANFEIDHPELFNPTLVRSLHRICQDHVGVDAASFVAFVKHMIDEIDTFLVRDDLHAV